MKYSLLFVCLLSLLFVNCKKEQNRQLLDAYFNYEISGKQTNIKDEILLKQNIFDCTITKDTSLYVHATKVYEGAGFIIRTENISDGTYTLDSYNKGFYENPTDKRIYYTDSKHMGTLTLQRGTFQGKTLLNTMHATFQFEGIDTTTGKTFKLTKGEFLMELKTK